MVSNTVKDLSRAVARADENASASPMDTPPGESLSFGEMLNSVATGIAYEFERAGISHRKISDETVVAILAAHGMSPFGLTQWGADIADRVRSDFGHGRWSSETLAQVAEASRAYANVRDGVE
jgi:hypothetical protein